MKNLQQELQAAEKAKALAEKKIQQVNEKIQKQQDKNKPKNIWDKIKTLSQLYKHLKVDPKKDVINIQGFDKEDTKVLENLVTRMRVCKAYNENRVPKRGNKRYYPYHYLNSAGAGLVFGNSAYNDVVAHSGSAARLSFLTKEGSDNYAKNFLNVEENIISL
jgi:hypothetical protein